MKKLNYMLLLSVLLSLLFVSGASASYIAYEALPNSNSQYISQHRVGGPVLADDFISAKKGLVDSIEWWGTNPLSQTGTDRWEITFHADNGGVPAATSPFGGLSQHFVLASGSDIDGDGIYHYMAQWTPMDIYLVSGVSYWFSVANASGSGWSWAYGNAPTVGSEIYEAAVSTGIGPNGGPHFGPWDRLSEVDFAFRIGVVPEPTSIALLGLGLTGLWFAGRFKKQWRVA